MNNTELAAAGRQFRDLMSSDTALIEIAKMISNLADKLDVTTLALREKCKQYDALVVENAGLKKSEVPLGAIENGRVFAERLEAYPFECHGVNLNMCSDWQELRRCFEHLSEWAMHSQDETPATDAALANIQAQGVQMFALRMEFNGFSSEAFGAREYAAELRKEAGNV